MCQPTNHTKMARSILKIQTQQESLSMTEDKQKSISKSQRKGLVSFDLIEIRSYPRMLDTSREGPALTIGWEPIASDVTTVLERYLERSSRSTSRGKLNSTKAEHRIWILLDEGYDKDYLMQHILYFSADANNNSRPQPKTIYQKLKKAALKFSASVVNAAA